MEVKTALKKRFAQRGKESREMDREIAEEKGFGSRVIPLYQSWLVEFILKRATNSWLGCKFRPTNVYIFLSPSVAGITKGVPIETEPGRNWFVFDRSPRPSFIGAETILFASTSKLQLNRAGNSGNGTRTISSSRPREPDENDGTVCAVKPLLCSLLIKLLEIDMKALST